MKYSFIEKIIVQVIKFKVKRWFNLEKELALKPGFISASSLSPAKTWPDPEKIPSGEEIPFTMENIKIIGKNLRSCISQGMYAVKSVKNNPVNPNNKITHAQLDDLKKYAQTLGIKHIGFTKVPPRLIFQQRGIRYDNAIVLIKEMDKQAISKAPGVETFKTVFETYDSLGIATNKLTAYLQSNNFYAQASHPLGGLVLYPPLAQKAGLGWMGKHGLLITPWFGSRQRISAIFTSAENLPFSDDNQHQWVGDFCEKCKKCIRTCPPNAILHKPVVHASGQQTHIVRAKCLPYFVHNHGCSVCLKDCIFSFKDYHSIKNRFLPKTTKN